MTPPRRAGARGAAAIMAMLLAALASAIAVTLFADQQRWTHAVLLRRDQVQAQALAMAGVQWARQVLLDAGRDKPVDHLGEPWAMALPPIPLENGEIRGGISDATARLNINSLAAGSAVERARFERLFAQRGVSPDALDAIADWIDIDDASRPAGAEDAYYTQQAVPGVTGNRPFVRIAELAAVRGMTLPALAAVEPFLAALPAGTAINVNTASPEVLAAILNAPANAVAQVVASREQRPFSSIQDFRSRLPKGMTLPSTDSLTVRSDYFYVTVEARQGATVARARALLHRLRPTARRPEVVWQIVE